MKRGDRVRDKRKQWMGVGIVERVAEHPCAEVVIDVRFPGDYRCTYFQFDDLEVA